MEERSTKVALRGPGLFGAESKGNHCLVLAASV